MNIAVSFPGGAGVDTRVGGHVVRTDQPAPHGEGTAPAPFDQCAVKKHMVEPPAFELTVS